MSTATVAVADASVVIKWFIKEPDSPKALKLRDKHALGQISLMAPHLLPFEVLNALRYSALYNENELEMLSETISAYGFNLHPLVGDYAQATIKTAMENNVTVYDAAYVALAARERGLLYTADDELLATLKPKYRRFVRHIADL